jgi:hypothetical protein
MKGIPWQGAALCSLLLVSTTANNCAHVIPGREKAAVAEIEKVLSAK